MQSIKVYFFLKTLLSALFGVGVGLFLLMLAPYAAELFDIMVIAIGLLTVVMNVPALLLAMRNISRKGEWVNLTMVIFSIALGIALMLLRSDFLLVLIAIYAIVLPLVRVLLVEDRLRQLKREMLPFMTGLVVVLVFLAEAEALILRYGGIAAMVVSGIYFLHGLLALKFRFSALEEECRDMENEE